MPNGGPGDPIYDRMAKRSHRIFLKSEYGPSYIIEFRFSGYAKEAIRELKNSISKNFHVTRRKIVPHITLVGPLLTKKEKRLVKEVRNVCKRYDLIKFKLDGFDNFEDRVIYVRIKPSEELRQLRLELVEKLQKFCLLSENDKESHFTFHATLVMKDIESKFDQIWEYLQTWKIPNIDQYVVRVTIIKNFKILAEYDLLQRKTLDRFESLDREKFHKTIKKLDEKREGSDIEFEDVADKGKIYVFSDAHFDHSNIIRYCRRPFDSTRQMNQELLVNWKSFVKENDTIYYLGDMTYGRNRHPTDYWLGKLSGAKYYIRGNHDSDSIRRAEVIHDRYGIEYCDYKFLLMHNPHRPLGYNEWIIHGDKHNNDLEEYPFINQKNKTVNVCADVVNYTPLSLDTLILMIESGRSYKTING